MGDHGSYGQETRDYASPEWLLASPPALPAAAVLRGNSPQGAVFFARFTECAWLAYENLCFAVNERAEFVFGSWLLTRVLCYLRFLWADFCCADIGSHLRAAQPTVQAVRSHNFDIDRGVCLVRSVVNRNLKPETLTCLAPALCAGTSGSSIFK